MVEVRRLRSCLDLGYESFLGQNLVIRSEEIVKSIRIRSLVLEISVIEIFYQSFTRTVLSLVLILYF